MIVVDGSAKLIDENEITPQSKYVWIRDNGTCTWYPRYDRCVTHCSIDVTWFPFDVQICKLIFLPWRVSDCLMLNITVGNPRDLGDYFESEEWYLIGACYQSTNSSSNNNNNNNNKFGQGIPPVGCSYSEIW